MKKIFAVLLLILFIPLYGTAKISLPKIFSDHMVIQQNEPIVFYGYAKPDEQVTGKFLGEEVSTFTKDNGKWKLTFKAHSYGGPFTLSLKGENYLELQDIYLGEVWFCSGQSNMGWKVENSLKGEEEVAQADFPEIRLFQVKRQMASTPQKEVSGGSWEPCSPSTIRGFSAVAYFFGRELYKNNHVPIGLINSSWGGTNIEAWMAEELFERDTKRQKILTEMKQIDISNIISQYSKANKNYGQYLDTIDVGSKENWENLSTDYSDWQSFALPNLWRDTSLEKTFGVVWVTKTIVLSSNELSNTCLSIGRVDNEDICFINGKMVGKSTKKDLKRIYKIPTNILKKGENRITIRTKNLGDLGGFRSAKKDLYLETPTRKIPLSGEWKYKVGTTTAKNPPKKEHPRNYPSSLYNGMVEPFLNYNIQGVIWYQGESNAKNYEEYEQFFPKMIQDWREKWNKKFPFYFVQLANYANQNNNYPFIREAQAATLQLDKTAMVVTLDIGEDFNVHYPNKQEVGKRLAMIAQHDLYGDKKITAMGPKVKSIKLKQTKAIICFDSKIRIKGNPNKINGFQVAGENMDFKDVFAKKISDHKIEINSSQIKFVRYLWKDAPGEVMIYNEQNLPAAPFRTDSTKPFNN